jgi:hypothetical protein
MAKGNIPAPSKELLDRRKVLFGTDNELIFDTVTKKWKIAKSSSIKTRTQVFYKDWEAGAKTYDYTPSSISGNEDPNYTGSTADKTAVDNALTTATITYLPDGKPVVNFAFPNPADPKGAPTQYEAYLYVDDNVASGPDEAIEKYKSGNEFTFNRVDNVTEKHLKDLYKIHKNKQGVIDTLYEAGYLKSKKNIPTDEMLAALNNASAQYTVDQVEAYKSGQIKEFVGFNSWLGAREKPEGLGGTRTVPQITEFSDTDARNLIDNVVKSLMGRGASDTEYAKLVPLLQKKQNKNPALVTTTTNEEGRVTAQKTKTGMNEQQFLIEKLSQRDEAKATKILSYYDAFKQAIGVK